MFIHHTTSCEPRLLPRSFEYHAPHSTKEAIDLLSKLGSETKILAGGMSLIPMMKLRLASPEHVIDINGIRELEYVREDSGSLLIGSLTRHHTLESSNLVQQRVPLLSETATQIGDPQVRNLGTIGGSLAHCDPSGDLGAAILALRGELTILGAKGERRLKIDDFQLDMFSSALEAQEILTQVSVPVPGRRSGHSYKKLERKAGDFATAGVAVQISLDERGVFQSAGIGLTALGPTNLRARKAEGALLGKEPSDKLIAEAAAAAADEAEPSNDPLRGSAEYKRDMARVLAQRALRAAVGIAMGAKQEGKKN
jgi:aerobic carbon-monoxide dehydrogenase medium subunit